MVVIGGIKEIILGEGSKKVIQSVNGQSEFYGAIIGIEEPYREKAYMLQHLQAVSLLENESGNLEIVEFQHTGSLAEVYYVPEYQEYCVRPLKMRAVCLSCGQWLGQNRLYYLPRNTELCLNEKKQKLILA